MNKTDKKNYAIRKEYIYLLSQLPQEHRKPFNSLFKTEYNKRLKETDKSGTYDNSLWRQVFLSLLEDYATHFFNLPTHGPDVPLAEHESIEYETTQAKAIKVL